MMGWFSRLLATCYVRELVSFVSLQSGELYLHKWYGPINTKHIILNFLW
jgi:hypothetical protein